MKTIEMNSQEQQGFSKALAYVEDFCQRNPCTVGAAEIALGAGLIVAGVKLGAVEMGSQLVGLAGSPFNASSLVTGLASGGAGVAAGIVGAIGVVGLGTAIGISAPLLAAAGAVVGFTAGYTVGDITHNLLNPGIDWPSFLGGGSLLLVGVGLVLDGCRRILASEVVQQAISFIKDGVIHLVNTAAEVVCRTVEELRNFGVVAPAACALAAGTVGAIAGTSVAASTVTVLGSHALGGVALSLGLVSAPVWPVVLCGAGAAALGVAVWSFFKRR